MRDLNNQGQYAGFTLIELLIVAVILSSLAAIVMPQFSSVGDSSKKSSTAYSAKIVRAALDRYRADNGFYPQSSHWGDSCSGITRGPRVATGTPYAFLLNRLALYGDGQGGVCDERTSAFHLGPYLNKHIPANPRNGSAAIKLSQQLQPKVTHHSPSGGTTIKKQVNSWRSNRRRLLSI